MIPQGLSVRDYARRRGCTPAAVRLALRTGRITANADGTVDPARADADWADATDPRRGNPGGRAPAAPVATNGRAPGELPSRAESERCRSYYLSELARLKAEEAAGRLVDAEDVRLAAYASARTARDHLMAIPDRLAAILAGASDAAEVHKIMSDEIRRVCVDLSQGLPKP